MFVSTRGRYALRVIIDIAENSDDNYIPLKDVVVRQGISQKYLESIMTDLSKAGLLDALHGKGGGYKLSKKPEEIKVIDILNITELDLAPISCLNSNAEPCDKAFECRTLPMWKGLNDLISNYFNGISIRDLMKIE